MPVDRVPGEVRKLFPNLTALRGLAALLIVVFHVNLLYGNRGGEMIQSGQTMLLSKFYLMVDFFFVLSGFIICHVYMQQFMEGLGRQNLKKFIVSRFARIYPLHLLTLVMLIVLRLWYLHTGAPDDPYMKASDTWISIPGNLLLVQSMNLYDWFSWNNASWSISTEWWVYMLFPFMVRPLMSSGRWIVVLVTLVALSGYLSIMFYFEQRVTVSPILQNVMETQPVHNINVGYQYGFIRCLCGFLLGMMAYRAYLSGLGKKLSAHGYMFLSLSCALLLCMQLDVWDVFSVCFFAPLILLAAYGSRSMDRLFSLRPLQLLGKWSYSIYLIHLVIFYTLTSVVHQYKFKKQQVSSVRPDTVFGWEICIVLVALTVFASYFLYTYVELPARKYLKQRAGLQIVQAEACKIESAD